MSSKHGKRIRKEDAFFGAISIGAIFQPPEAVFKETHGVWDPMQELTITHLISQSTPLSAIPPKGKGGGGRVGKISLIGF